MAKRKRIASLATHPPRFKGMMQVIDDLLPQVDEFNIWLNDYPSVPSELINVPKLNVHWPVPNLRSLAKFYWATACDDYYLTVDDDILFPADYVDHIVAGLERYDCLAFVGYHAHIMHVQPDGTLPKGFYQKYRTMFHYTAGSAYDMGVHVLGTGVMACVPSRIGLSFRDILPDTSVDLPRCGDDELVALFSQRHNIPMVKLQSEKNWMGYDFQLCNVQPLHKCNVYQDATEKAMREWNRWQIIRFKQ